MSILTRLARSNKKLGKSFNTEPNFLRNRTRTLRDRNRGLSYKPKLNRQPRYATQADIGFDDPYAGRFANVRQKINPLQAQRLKETTGKTQRNLEIGDRLDQNRIESEQLQTARKLWNKKDTRVASNLNKEVKQLRKQSPTRETRNLIKEKQQQSNQINRRVKQANNGADIQQDMIRREQSKLASDLAINRSRFNKKLFYLANF